MSSVLANEPHERFFLTDLRSMEISNLSYYSSFGKYNALNQELNITPFGRFRDLTVLVKLSKAIDILCIGEMFLKRGHMPRTNVNILLQYDVKIGA